MNDINDALKVFATDYVKCFVCGCAGAAVGTIAIKSVKFAASKTAPIAKKALDNLKEKKNGYVEIKEYKSN